jgi:hypothetical protein
MGNWKAMLDEVGGKPGKGFHRMVWSVLLDAVGSNTQIC